LKSRATDEAALRDEIRAAELSAAQADVNREAFKKLGEAAGKVGTMLVRMAELGINAAQMAHEKNERERARNDRKRDLAIAETRSPRRRAKLQRAADLESETRRLMREDPKLTEGEAADEAERGIQVREKASGKRTIRGAVPGGYEGLDGFKRGRSNLDHGEDRSLPGQKEKDAAKQRGESALRRARDTADQGRQSGKASDTGIWQEMVNRLDRLIEAVTKPVAERIAPKGRATAGGL
jgi:hypothetical protein